MVTLVFLTDKIRRILALAIVKSGKVEGRISWHFYAKPLTLFHGAGSCLQVTDVCFFPPKIY